MQIILLAESLKHASRDVAVETQAPGGSGILIGNLAAHAGVSSSEIKFYENQGLLASTGKGKWRTYDAENAQRLQAIIKLRNMGLSLARIRESLALAELPDKQRGHDGMMRILQSQITELQQVGELVHMQLEQTRHHMARLAEMAPADAAGDGSAGSGTRDVTDRETTPK